MQITGVQSGRTYSVSLPEPQALELRVPLHGCRVAEVTDISGQKLAFTLLPHPSGDFLEVRLAPAKAFGIQVHTTPASAPALSPAEPLPAPFRQGGPRLAGRRQTLPIDDKFNSDSIFAQNFWRHAPIKVEVPSCLKTSSTPCELHVGPSSFHVSPKGRNLVRIEVGQLHPYTQELELSEFPDSFLLPIGKPVQGIEFLTAAELGSRLTGVKVGEVELQYATGAEGKEPLVYGRNIDCFSKPFATETDNYEIDPVSYLSTLVVKADSSRNLASIKLHLYAADASIGVLGINLVLPE
jgi:hypothetical protein